MIKKIKDLLNKNTVNLFLCLDLIGITKITKKIFHHFFLSKKKRLRITNIEELSKPISLSIYMMGTSELHKSNDWYGHATVLKKFAGIDNDYPIKAAIEHGADLNPPWERDLNSPFRVLIGFGKNCHNYPYDITKKVYTIGPFIHYAQSQLTPHELTFERKRLKKNLLVFPSHSTTVTDASYDIEEFCKKLTTMKRNFKSIRICLYWKDINNGIHRIYRKCGFECVTAGHIFDPLFLPRLKSIIETSTITMSNAVGTHIGYCIFLKKPHYFFSQQVDHRGTNKDEIKLITHIEKSDIYQKIENAFSIYSETISEKQSKLVDLYWGLSEIKTKQELRSIIDDAEKIYQENTKLHFF